MGDGDADQQVPHAQAMQRLKLQLRVAPRIRQQPHTRLHVENGLRAQNSHLAASARHAPKAPTDAGTSPRPRANGRPL